MSLVKKALAKSNDIVAESTQPLVADEPPKAKPQETATKQTDYKFFEIALSADLAQLKTFKDIADKADYKATALEKNDYLDYLKTYRIKGENHPNRVLAWVFIWLVDLKRWNQVLDLFPTLVEQKQPLPKQFKTSDWATFLVDQIYDDANWYLNNKRKPDKHAHTAFILARIIDVVKDHDWTGREIAGGKLYAIAMKLEAAQNNFGNAIRYGRLAQQINDKAGVKTLLEKLEKKYSSDELKETTQSQPQEA
ncbi:phage terminase small subunit [Pseudoalteromonas luteoviolacea]|uniref:phage terminase small subunit n=1 Tax=Pseudoalteromonas luteoviolacea TaxID=43657 RepID=UPI001EED2CC8|nr:phage terminase small subunit [Pseudoalteromonas luteoviolacea]MCF6442345.1 phage terminase small subunit [Pseudoalteromonas luteoviolacea]